MAVRVLELYRDVLPKTNCGDCGMPTCFAFASMVVVEKRDLGKCPHIEKELLEKYRQILNEQWSSGTWVKKDQAADALEWAKIKSASMEIADLPGRIGGVLKEDGEGPSLTLPYFNDFIIIRKSRVMKSDGTELNPWEQVFIYNHMAQGGSSLPSGRWISFHEIPNTIPKLVNMQGDVEDPIKRRFTGKLGELAVEAAKIGGVDKKEPGSSADAVFLFTPLPRIPVMLLFWDEDRKEGFDADVKLHFDETITEHLDIESIMFLSERLRRFLCGEGSR